MPRPVSLKARALRCLAQREHSPQELRGKLLRLLSRQPPGGGCPGGDPDSVTGDPAPAVDPLAEVDALLQWLAANGHLSPERFVESRVHARQSRFGNLRIRQELRQHGLQADAATRQILHDTEEQRARDVWQRKFGRPAADAKQRLQQLRFLAGRGFSIEVVRRVVLGAAGDLSDADADKVAQADPSSHGD